MKLRDKLYADLAEMQSLVEEGIAYARSLQASQEPPKSVELHSFLQSIAFDYADAGMSVNLQQAADGICQTRPQALRHLVCNLVDNALQFAGAVEIRLQAGAEGQWLVRVVDRGPGTPEADLEAVMEPYLRLEDSCRRSTGLSLAIANELAKHWVDDWYWLRGMTGRG